MKGDGGALNVNEAVFCMGVYKICSCTVHRINVSGARGRGMHLLRRTTLTSITLPSSQKKYELKTKLDYVFKM